jgi:hypothetical protein
MTFGSIRTTFTQGVPAGYRSGREAVFAPATQTTSVGATSPPHESGKGQELIIEGTRNPQAKER